jgi:hypothetical protein
MRRGVIRGIYNVNVVCVSDRLRLYLLTLKTNDGARSGIFPWHGIYRFGPDFPAGMSGWLGKWVLAFRSPPQHLVLLYLSMGFGW